MNKTSLAEKQCADCRSPKLLLPDQIQHFRTQLNPDWRIAENKRLERSYKFKDFRHALAFTNKVGELAEQQNHHPDILLGWGKVQLTLTTHSAGGLTESDFILATKIDRL